MGEEGEFVLILSFAINKGLYPGLMKTLSKPYSVLILVVWGGCGSENN
jgi:hypothetical protein